MLRKTPRILTYLTLLLLGGVLLAPVITYATLTLDSTSLSSDGALTLKSASSSVTLIGETNQTGAITVASSSQTLTLNLGTGTGATTVNIATGATNAKTVNIGTGANLINTLTIGSPSSTLNLQGKTVTIASSTDPLTINIAANTGAHTVNIATGGTNAKTINIGTSAQLQNTITIGNASSSIALSGTLRITEGNQGAGKFLGSDASGNATWQAVDGWIDSGETWTYASADSPTFTFTVASDVTAKYTPGQRIKLTQTTVKYFLITAVSTFSGGNTTITVYGGTDYTLTNAAISANYYSGVKAPFGFPLDPSKWTVETKATSSYSQATPVSGTWYNLGSLSISIPIGTWRVYYQGEIYGQTTNSTNVADAFVTLSTANNSESNTDFTTSNLIFAVAGTRTDLGTPVFRENVLSLAAKTTYYLNEKAVYTSNSVQIVGGASATIIRAVSAYL